MKSVEKRMSLSGRTLLKSTSHVRVKETKGNYLRSILVGFQFAFFLPYELVTVVFWPFIRNVCGNVFIALDSLFFVVWSAISAIISGFSGYLDATNEPVNETQDDE